MTFLDLLPWARAIARAIEDAGVEGDTPHVEALKIQREIVSLIEDPPRSDVAASWTRCNVPLLMVWVADCYRLGRPARARMYEAIVALRLLTAEACLSGRGGR